MVGLSGLWMPIAVSAVFVFIATMIVHMLPGWHKSDMAAVPGEAKFMETTRGLNVPPGEYRFPFSNDTKEMQSPEWDAKMTQGPVGVMSVAPNGPMPFGKMLGLWFAYSLFISLVAAYVTGRTHAQGAPFADVFCTSTVVAFCSYVLALWQRWIWWGQGTRYTITYSVDGIIFALVTGATFGWLWPK